MDTIPFVDLRAQIEPLRDEIDAAMAAVVDRCSFILGPEVAAFEADFASYCGTRHAVGVASGLDALTLALQALDIGPGDEVITAANTFTATVCAIARAGATPVLVDCDEDTACLDPAAVEAAITPRTRALMPVHLYGQLADMGALAAVAEAHDLAIVEDAAQAHGARRGGRAAGSFGAAGCFSFYPAKNLGAFGDGGAITTDDPALAERVRLLGNYGQKTKNVHELAGGNSRLDTVQAALLAVKLRHLDEANAARRRAAAAYHAGLAGGPARPLPLPDEAAAHVWHLFIVRTPDRDRVRARLADAQIQSGLHYPHPVHLQPAWRHLAQGRGSFPVAERLADELLSLPMYPGLRDDQVARVCDVLQGHRSA